MEMGEGTIFLEPARGLLCPAEHPSLPRTGVVTHNSLTLLRSVPSLCIWDTLPSAFPLALSSQGPAGPAPPPGCSFRAGRCSCTELLPPAASSPGSPPDSLFRPWLQCCLHRMSSRGITLFTSFVTHPGDFLHCFHKNVCVCVLSTQETLVPAENFYELM